MSTTRRRPARLLWLGLVALAAIGCHGEEEVMVAPLPLDAGLVGDASPRPLAIVGDRVSDRLELYSLAAQPARVPEQVAALSLDDHAEFVDEPFDLAVSPDRRFLYVVLGHGTAWKSGKLVKIRLADGARAGEVTLGEEPSMIALSADGRRAFVTLFRNLDRPQGPWSDPGALVVVDTEAMSVQGEAATCAAALGVALDEPAGRAWVACAGSGELAVVSVPEGRLPQTMRVVPLADGNGARAAQPAYVALVGDAVVASAQGSGELWILDRAAMTLRKRIAYGSDAFPQRLLPIDDHLVLVALDGHSQVGLLDVARQLPLSTIELPGVHPQALARSGADLLITDENDLRHPGRLVKAPLDCQLAGQPCAPPAFAPTAIFPQAVLVVP